MNQDAVQMAIETAAVLMLIARFSGIGGSSQSEVDELNKKNSRQWQKDIESWKKRGMVSESDGFPTPPPPPPQYWVIR